MLEVKQVSKLYGNDRGVHNIDFSMQRGEIVGFLGPNGAGKTTTMRMITGYLNPTHGQIWVDGHSMADNPKKARRKIGYLPETPPLYPEMTVQSYLRFIANLRDVPAREQKLRVGEAIDKLGLQGREKQIIRSLSKGYKQRLGLAQAILHQPDLLILDEPTSGLDPKQIIEIRQLIHELGENHTVLLSTHILPEINAICNRVLIINQGRVVLDERPEHLGRTMGETFEVSLEVKGPRERILTELRSLPSVGEVKEVDAPEAGAALLATPATPALESAESAIDEADSPAPAAAPAESVKLLVTSADRAEDIREAVFFRLASAGLPILAMKRESLSLEDIFLKLTTDEPAAPELVPTEEGDTDA
ncbi:ABC transporter ATP-binding protein [Paenibacillus qinlingensis]|uniref:ABC transporter ATP-binding protein n=1 Tax=Paenibacillus qinlingensis TaxID=1837343 RepID=UPI0015643F5D|nr:ATP-binding cassette domain-containing protein [Paenibacillus qinlingensis]NQX61870.1 ATP-binding cassette domain-containing protein [Paenibacillus qinlingensis]